MRRVGESTKSLREIQDIIMARFQKDIDVPINIRILMAKGGTFEARWLFAEDPDCPYPPHMERNIVEFEGRRLLVGGEWLDSSGTLLNGIPDSVGTLEGLAGMLRELAEAPEGIYMLAPQANGWVCAVAGSWKPSHFSPMDRPGDCVGEALIAKLAREGANDRSE